MDKLKKPGRPVDEDLRNKRVANVLNAAEKLIALNGIRETNMRAICAEAGLSPGAVYRDFASKDAIIMAIAGRARAERQNLVDVIEAGQSLRTTLLEHAEEIVAFSSDPIVGRLTVEFAALAIRRPDVAEAFDASDEILSNALHGALTRDIASGALSRDTDVDSLTEALLVVFAGLAGRGAFPGQIKQKTVLDGFIISIQRILL